MKLRWCEFQNWLDCSSMMSLGTQFLPSFHLHSGLSSKVGPFEVIGYPSVQLGPHTSSHQEEDKVHSSNI